MMVLLIEDEVAMVELATRCLREHQTIVAAIDVVSCSRLKAGLELAFSQKFDTIILDLSLPDSSHDQTRQAISVFASKAPVVVLTGDDDPERARECIKNGAVDFIYKGEDLKKLQHAVIRAALEKDYQTYESERSNRMATRLIGSELRGISNQLNQLR